jgi:hypothetical protein
MGCGCGCGWDCSGICWINGFIKFGFICCWVTDGDGDCCDARDCCWLYLLIMLLFIILFWLLILGLFVLIPIIFPLFPNIFSFSLSLSLYFYFYFYLINILYFILNSSIWPDVNFFGCYFIIFYIFAILTI